MASGPLAKSDNASNRRRNGRKRVLIAGKIVSGGGAIALECKILDVSDSGAQIRFSKSAELPSQFHLIDIPGMRVHLASVAWVKSNFAGLGFSESHALDSTLPHAWDYLRKIWIESAMR